MAAPKDYSLPLAEARRRLDGQLSIVDATRNRVISLLGLGGLLGTFVGGLGAIQEGAAMTPALWVAAGAFGVAVVAGLVILAPWKFHDGMRANPIVGWVDDGHAIDMMQREIALRVEQQYEKNSVRVARLQFGLMVVVAALGVEFVALAYQLSRST
jgi:hypothetical protein